MSSNQNLVPPSQIPQQNELGNILGQINKYASLAAQAVLQAQQEGIGQTGETKSQMALGFVHTGLKTAGLIVPGLSAVGGAEQALEPIFVPLFTSIVNIFKSHGHPAFTQPTPPANPAPTSPASGH